MLRGISRLATQKAMPRVIMPQYRGFANLLRYTQSHEWINYDTESGMGTIGLTNHAQEQIGDIVFVELPEIGTVFSAEESICCVESTKTAADIYQMCDGEVVEVNEQLEDDPALVNEDAENEGWIMKVKVTNYKQLHSLMEREAYDETL